MKYANEGRVLLLDDERLVRFTISAWLKTSNFEVVAVATPEEAIAELKVSSFDAVLSDVMMGTIDGFMFRDTVRGFNGKLPIIFLTALISSPSNQLTERISEDPHSYYVPKNAKRNFLLGRLRQAIHAYRADREAEKLKTEIQADLKIAARVQYALLPPRTCYDKHIYYSSIWLPHDVVSGDLFCWFPLQPYSALLVFGDIAGHGTPAALAMTAVMAHIKALDDSEGVRAQQPHLICQEIDNYIRTNLCDVTYMAGTVMFLNFQDNFVRYMNAGGIEPLCFRSGDGSLVELNPEHKGCLPMGMIDGSVYTPEDTVEVHLPDDGLICLYSDGYIDLTSDSEGENRLPHEILCEIISELVRDSDSLSEIGSIPYQLSSLAKDMGYVHAHDDMTFLLIGAPPKGHAHFIDTVSMKPSDRINDAVDRASRWAASQGYPDMTVAQLELLLCEHLENVRKHGLDDNERRREIVVVEIWQEGDELKIQAWDRGRLYEGDLSASAPSAEFTLDEQNDLLASSGRGWAIMRKICHDMTYDRFNGLNKYTFTMGVQN